MNRIYRFFGLKHGEDIAQAIRSFSLTQKLLWLFFLCVFFAAILNILRLANEKLLVEVPAYGGSYTEGIIGVPRFVNPVLATSDADRDVTALVYSGLLRLAPDGQLVPDLAEKYDISEDGLVYTFTLKSGLVWHDGRPLTAEDVEFTIQKIQDPALKSPKLTNWKGVTVERTNSTLIKFRLKQPFPGFLENATVGIIPKHLWKGVDPEAFPFSTLNTRAVGSGPFVVAATTNGPSGIPELFTLSAFENFALGRPKIQEITIHFYGNENDAVDALKSGKIQALAAISPERVDEIQNDALRIESTTLPRVFSVFFNQNQQQLFTSRAVRLALSTAIDKEALISEALRGHGTPVNGPIPPGSLGFTEDEITPLSAEKRLENARKLLTAEGWKLNESTGFFEKQTIDPKTKKVTKTAELAFSLTTGDAPGLKGPAEILAREWRKLGANVTLTVFETADLNQDAIRPRKYDALFFGEVMGRDPDLFSFWHSSQRNDPGLNIALYTSIGVDKLLNQIRSTIDREERITLYEKIEEEIERDAPAVFLYSPEFLYVVPKTIKNTEMQSLVTNQERFLNTYQWYITTEKIWTLFLK